MGGIDGLPSMETQPNCVDVTLKLDSTAEVACHFAEEVTDSQDHTRGCTNCVQGNLASGRVRKPLVEEYPNQDKLRKILVRQSDSNLGFPDKKPRVKPSPHAHCVAYELTSDLGVGR